MGVIPVIDLFAGPGGLGEGFSSYRVGERNIFQIRLSIEMDSMAHRTLLLRSFYRQFDPGEVPDAYYEYLRGAITRDDLEAKHPESFKVAAAEAWQATLGKTDPNEVSRRISAALGPDKDQWLLIGGPPCQAFSLVGRSRIIGGKGLPEYEKDHRHLLYREYLRIIARHRPSVFVMENVKGLLSATVGGQLMFPLIRKDLEDPLRVFPELQTGTRRTALRYTLFSAVVPPGTTGGFAASDFVVHSEDYGVPQARHRVIILGIRHDIDRLPDHLKRSKPITVEEVIGDLPRLRSSLSSEDTPSRWKQAIQRISEVELLGAHPQTPALAKAIGRHLGKLRADLPLGGAFVPCDPNPAKLSSWFVAPRLGGACNHEARRHIAEDLLRYFYASVFASTGSVHRSPVLSEFPTALLPAHKNVQEAVSGKKFGDRFRVQVADRPSTTVVSHISKDGHYYIHYDPCQCRSLTVREAARLQTFPDNYFFEGPRTEQYRQVGNAVPPLLARQIAVIVGALFDCPSQ